MTDDQLMEIARPFAADGGRWPSGWLNALRAAIDAEHAEMLKAPEAPMDRNVLGDKIAELLKGYRLAHTEDDEGYGFPLVDAVTPPNAGTVTLGLEELENLAGEIAWLVIPAERTEERRNHVPE